MRDLGSFLLGAIVGIAIAEHLILLALAVVYYLENVRGRDPSSDG